MLKKIFSITTLVFASVLVFGQPGERNLNVDITVPTDTTKTSYSGKDSARKKKADRLYDRLGYKAAIEIYERLDAESKLDKNTMSKLANSFRLNNETTESENWYAKFVTSNSNTEDILNYGRVLQINGKCDEAAQWYEVFNTQVDASERINLDFIEDCRAMTVFRSNNDVSLVNLAELNSASLDFVAIPFRNGIVFTSTRGIDRISNNQDRWTKDNFSDLFFAERKSMGVYEMPTPLRGDINGKYHDGVAAFNNNQNVMYFSRNNRMGKNNKGLIDLKVYQATINENGNWEDAKDLNFNSGEFASCHPTVSADGSRMYFASNRPGGLGGMDIYVSKNMNGIWSAPVNCGAEVNSAGNEIFPHIGADGVLYFASNGHKGMGGLDIFAVKKSNTKDEMSWDKRTNVGRPFNTEKDDFGFSVSQDGMQGYLTSSRIGGEGEDDIYEWMTETPLAFFDGAILPAQRMIRVVDDATGEIISQAMVSVQDLNNPVKDLTLMTDNNGTVNPLVEPTQDLQINVKKAGYEPITQKMVAADILSNTSNPVIRLKRKMCTALHGMVINKDCNKPMPGASVRLFNKCTGDEEVYTTNADGNFDFCLDCACEYVIVGSKDKFVDDQTELKTIKGDCNAAKPFDVTLHLDLKEKAVVSTPMPTPAPAPAVVHTPAPAVIHTPVSSRYGDLYAGKSILLKDIYYDYNKFNIRADASTDLNNLLDLMNQYPTLEIELGSHTDARGSEEYNSSLSSNRATAAMQYLVKRGVSPTRIIAVGYGESKIINHCANGVKCSDEAHQENRRTEVRVTKIGDSSIRIEHKR